MSDEIRVSVSDAYVRVGIGSNSSQVTNDATDLLLAAAVIELRKLVAILQPRS